MNGGAGVAQATTPVQPGKEGALAWTLPLRRLLRSHRSMRAFAVLAVLAVATYAANGLFGEISPASVWGIWYGVAATLLLVAAMGYAGRRRALAARTLGPSRTYLLVHLYGGTLFLLLLLMHSGFSLPEGPLTWLLWLLGVWVVLTGLCGVALQKWCAATLSQLRTEVQLQRIPDLVTELKGRGEDVASDGSAIVKDLFASELAPALAAPVFRWRSFAGYVDDRESQFDFVESIVPGERRAALDQLREIVRTKAEVDVHYALQTALRRWLWVHVPAALVLTGLIALHVFVVVYY